MKKTTFLFGIMLTLFVFLGLISLGRQDFILENIENFNRQLALSVADIFVIILGCYGVLLFSDNKEKIVKKHWIILGFILLVAIVCPPFLSQDTAGYVIGARNFVWLHMNPYSSPLNGNSANSWLRGVGPIWWLNFPFSYGPVFLLISALAILPNFASITLAIFSYKLFALGAYAAAVFLFFKLSSQNENKIFRTFMFALNPAVIISAVWEGHNDIFTMMFLLLSLWLLNNSRYTSACLSFLGSIFIKYNSVIFLPIFWKDGGKFSFKKILLSICGLVVALVAFFLIFNLKIVDFYNVYNDRCLYSCSPVIYLFDYFFPSKEILLRLFSYAAYYAMVSFIFLYKKDKKLEFIFWSFFGLIFIFTKWLTPWYPILIIPMGLLIDSEPYDWMVLFLTFYSLLHCFGI
jgi:hypothetical protein